jgi:phospholipase/carboxylesterase
VTDVTALWARQGDAAPLVVLFHGRGSNEREIIGLAQHLPEDCAVVSLRGPVELGPGNYAWFQNQGIGRPIPASLRETMDWFTQWRSSQGTGRKVVLIGFSGGAAFVGGLALDDPSAYAGVQ